MPQFSVIVLNWNGKHFLETCLSSLSRQTYRDFETILVDNGSSDGSVSFVEDRFPEVQVLSLKDNAGFSGGNLAGFGVARGEIIVLLNNDTEADPSWLSELHTAACRFPETSFFASKMLYFDERQKIDNCGFSVTSFGATVDLGRDEADGPLWSEPRLVFGACAGAAAYRRSMLAEVGFLDLDFFMTYEDVDLSFRAQLLGHCCLFVPSAIVYHRYRSTMKKHPARQIYFSQRNIEFLYLTDMPLGLILRYFPQRIMYELGAFVYFALKGHAGTFLKAKADAILKIKPILAKRKRLQALKRITNGQLKLILNQNGGGSAKVRKLFSALFSKDSGREASVGALLL